MGLIGFICLVALAVWVWGLFNLPPMPALLLWWWPSLLAGALAGAGACVALEAARFVTRLRRKRRARALRKLAGPPAPPPEAISPPLTPADLTPAE